MLADTEKVITSALVMVPPPGQWPQLQAFRAMHDKSFLRWPPHLNLLYPFIPQHKLLPLKVVERITNAVHAALSGDTLLGSVVKLEQIDIFDHAHSCTLVLKPVPSEVRVARLCWVWLIRFNRCCYRTGFESVASGDPIRVSALHRAVFDHFRRLHTPPDAGAIRH